MRNSGLSLGCGEQVMLDYNKALQHLSQSPRITRSSLDRAPRQQGAYILWFDDNPLVCLKVGIAGPRQGKGLRGRLQYHFLSNPANTVLAKHLAADSTSGWAQGYGLTIREHRQEFLATRCFFQTIALPDLTREDLERFEVFIEKRLKPRYAGRVIKTR
jgi:hypothetical protein